MLELILVKEKKMLGVIINYKRKKKIYGKFIINYINFCLSLLILYPNNTYFISMKYAKCICIFILIYFFLLTLQLQIMLKKIKQKQEKEENQKTKQKKLKLIVSFCLKSA